MDGDGSTSASAWFRADLLKRWNISGLWTSSREDGRSLRMRLGGNAPLALRSLELLLLCVIAFSLRAPASHVSVLADSDEGVYIVQAQQWLRGGLPYVAVWDQHPVGLAAILAVGGWLTGNVLLAARWGSTLAVALTAYIVLHFPIAGRGRRTARAAGALLYIVCMTEMDGLAAQAEVFDNALVCLGSFLLFRTATRLSERKSPELPVLVAAGLVFGCAIQVKYVVVPECILLCSAFLISAYLKHFSLSQVALWTGILVVCGVLPTGVTVVFFLITGHMAEFLQANLYANITYVAMIPESSALLARLRAGVDPYSLLLFVFFACAAAILAWLPPGSRKRHGQLMVWLVVWLSAAALDICSPIKFWSHYFLALVAPLCIATSLALVLLQEWQAQYLGRVLALMVFGALVWLPARVMLADLAQVSSRAQVDVPRKIADDIKRLGPGGGLYVYDYHPVIYFLAGANPPTRYVLPVEMADFATSSGAHPLTEITRIFARSPRFVVVADPPLGEIPSSEVQTAIAYYLRSYQEVKQYTDPADPGRTVTLLAARSDHKDAIVPKGP